MTFIGAWPSGKAAAFDAEERRFESYRPSQYNYSVHYDLLFTAPFNLVLWAVGFLFARPRYAAGIAGAQDFSLFLTAIPLLSQWASEGRRLRRASLRLRHVLALKKRHSFFEI